MLHEKVYKMIKNNNYWYFLCLNKSSSLIMSAYFITWKQAESGHVKCKHKDTKFLFSCVHVHVSKYCVKAAWTQAAFTWKQLFQTVAVTRERACDLYSLHHFIACLCWCHCSCHFTRISCLCSCPCTYSSIALKNHTSLTLPVRDAHRK